MKNKRGKVQWGCERRDRNTPREKERRKRRKKSSQNGRGEQWVGGSCLFFLLLQVLSVFRYSLFFPLSWPVSLKCCLAFCSSSILSASSHAARLQFCLACHPFFQTYPCNVVDHLLTCFAYYMLRFLLLTLVLIAFRWQPALPKLSFYFNCGRGLGFFSFYIEKSPISHTTTQGAQPIKASINTTVSQSLVSASRMWEKEVGFKRWRVAVDKGKEKEKERKKR